MERKYYIPYYHNTDNINYENLFLLYLEADKTENKLLSVIEYGSENKLAERFNIKYQQIQSNKKNVISKSSISRLLTEERYNNYFVVDKAKKTITLKNDMRTAKQEKKRFVVLTNREIEFLVRHNENMLSTYYLYLKYYCGYSKNNSTDNTVEQFLEANGYSKSSGNNKENIYRYNELLEKESFIKIERYRDNFGKNRNCYTII